MESLALVIEPDGGLRRLVRDALREDGWQVVEACAVDEAVSAARRRPRWPLVFCSDSLRAGASRAPAGADILDTLREGLGPASYIVMTGTGTSPDAALDAILAGASDYIPGPCVPGEVRRRARVVRQRLLAALTEAAEPALIVNPDAVDADASAPGIGPLRLTLPGDTQPRTSDEQTFYLRHPVVRTRGFAPAAVACSRPVLD
jgi:DNA-binding response OmpR family regulator